MYNQLTYLRFKGLIPRAYTKCGRTWNPDTKPHKIRVVHNICNGDRFQTFWRNLRVVRWNVSFGWRNQQPYNQYSPSSLTVRRSQLTMCGTDPFSLSLPQSNTHDKFHTIVHQLNHNVAQTENQTFFGTINIMYCFKFHWFTVHI